MTAILTGLGFSAEDSVTVSTMYVAALRGLLLDLVVTGDTERVRKTIALLAARLQEDIETRSSPAPDASGQRAAVSAPRARGRGART